MNRRRSASKRGFPDNLYMDKSGYFSFRNPMTGKTKGIGRDKATAFSAARAANKTMAAMNPCALAQWVSGVEVMSLKAWIPTYRQLWIDLKKPASTTLAGADRYLTRFAETAFAHLPMSEITTVHISKYLDAIAENSGPGAALNMRARLMDIFSFAITKGHVETGKNPVEATLPPRYEPKRDRLSLEQFNVMRANASPWLAAAMNLALLTAQRVSDISEMKFADVQDGYLHVTQTKSQGGTKIKLDVSIGLSATGLTIGDVVKQCRDRMVSKYLIHQARTGGGYKAGDKFAAHSISDGFQKLREELGIKAGKDKTPPTFHEIRSLSERLYRQQYGKEFAQAMLGHKTESMTAKYDDLRGSDWLTVSLK